MKKFILPQCILQEVLSMEFIQDAAKPTFYLKQPIVF